MWIQLLCGFVLYRVVRRHFRHDDGVDVIESSDFNTLFSVASRLEKLYRGKAYVGLRIPDPDSASRQNIDLVLVANGEAVVISVKNLAGFVSVNSDGSWVCLSEHQHKEEHHPNPVSQGASCLNLSFGFQHTASFLFKCASSDLMINNYERIQQIHFSRPHIRLECDI